MTPRALPAIFPAMTEKDWLQQVRDAARIWGWDTYHTHNSRFSEKGFPDLVLCQPVRGRLIFAELKTERGKLTHDQSRWISNLNACGQRAYVWRPSDLDLVIATLKH